MAGDSQRKNLTHGHGQGNLTQLGLIESLPTQTAVDWKESGAAGYSTLSGRHSDTTLTDAICGAASAGRSGKLNPRLREWMLGIPIGWTEYDSPATESLHSWLHRLFTPS